MCRSEERHSQQSVRPWQEASMVSMRARVRPEQTKRSTEGQGAREASKDFLHSGTFWINKSQLKVLST